MTANYLLPAGTINNRTAYFYADTTKTFGPLVKKISDQILVILDYTTILAGHVINIYNFNSDAESNPPLYLTDPLLNATGTVLSFLISGGIDGQQYNITVATQVVGSSTPRDDVLTINMPSNSACDTTIPPMVSLLAGTSFISTNIRYFWGPNPPTGMHVLDQWFDTTTNILYEWATDGINYFWEEIGIAGTTALGDAPNNTTIYARQGGAWVAVPIQFDATSDGKIYVRNNDNWIPDPIQIDADMDGAVYGRQNGEWAPVTGGTGGGIADAPSDGKIYGRENAQWVPDIIQTDAPDSSLYARKNGAWAPIPATQTVPPVAIVYVFPGLPPTGQIINVPMTFGITVAAALASATVFDSTLATANAVFTLNKISGGVTTALGTVTITPTSHISCTLAGAGGTLVVGDNLQMIAPATQDTTLADVSITILVTRT